MIDYRAGEADDDAAIARLMCLAGGGLMEFMLEGVLPNCGPEDLLRLAISDPDSPIHHDNAVVGVHEGNVVALLLCYPSGLFGLSDVLRSSVPADRLDHLKNFFEQALPESLYVNSVAVDESMAGRGIGATLMAIADDLAAAQGADTLSLHVWADNAGAIHLYEKCGYAIAHHIDVGRHKLLDHDGGKLVMVKTLK